MRIVWGFFLLLIPAIANCDWEDNYFTQAHYLQTGLRLQYANYDLHDPIESRYESSFSIPSIHLIVASSEGTRTFGIGFGGKPNFMALRQSEPSTFHFTMSQHFNLEKSGLFFQLEALAYRIKNKDLENFERSRNLFNVNGGYTYRFNKHFSLSAYAGQVFDRFPAKNFEFQVGVIFEAIHTSDKRTNVIEDIPRPIFLGI